MRAFKDAEGRSWEIAITISTARRVKELLDVDLLEAVGVKMLERLIGDPVKLCDVIYVCVQKQCEDQQVSDEQFGEALAGDVIDHATTAFLEALTDFFPSGKRKVLQQALAKVLELETKALTRAEEMLTSGRLDRLAERQWQKIEELFPNEPPSTGG